MIDKLINKKVKVYVGSNSGCGVSNGNHGARTSVSSVIIISGTIVDSNDKLIHLQNTTTEMLSQVGVDIGFRDDSKALVITSEDTIIPMDNVLFINF